MGWEWSWIRLISLTITSYNLGLVGHVCNALNDGLAQQQQVSGIWYNLDLTNNPLIVKNVASKASNLFNYL